MGKINALNALKVETGFGIYLHNGKYCPYVDETV